MSSPGLLNVLSGRSDVGEPYMIGGPGGPDERFMEDLEAVDTYVRTQSRPAIEKFPKSLPLVEEYEKWRQELSWYDLNVVPNDTWNSARSKRNAINAAQNQVLPAWTVTEPGTFLSTAADVSKATMSPLTKFALSLGAGLGAILLLAYGASKISPVQLTRKLLASRTPKAQSVNPIATDKEIKS
jgi:hypothetical protein